MTSSEIQAESQQALIQESLEALRGDQPTEALDPILNERYAAEIALMLESLPPDLRNQAWEVMDAGKRAEALEHLSEAAREPLIDGMTDDALVATVEKMDADKVAAIVDELPDDISSPVFDGLDDTRQQRLQAALSHPAGTAARLMHTDVLSVRPDLTIGETLDYLQDHEPPRHTDGIMVCDAQETYLGKLYYTDLVHHPSRILVSDVMVENADWVNADTSEADVARLFEQHNLVSAAVVDQDGKFVGRLTSADVMPLIHQEAEKPYLKASGLSDDEDLFAPIGPSTRRRGVWLAINLATAFLAAWVIGLFQETLE